MHTSTFTFLVGLFASAATALTPQNVIAQELRTDLAAGGHHPISIAQLMTPAEIEATGLRSLAPEQVTALNAWLQSYRAAVERRVIETAEEEFTPVTPIIESQIDGGFDGWVGDTVFRLQNGQIWQQVSPSAKYHTAEAPRVTITRSPFRMRVEGVAIEIDVQRIK